jgi:hypothetical protein
VGNDTVNFIFNLAIEVCLWGCILMQIRLNGIIHKRLLRLEKDFLNRELSEEEEDA